MHAPRGGLALASLASAALLLLLSFGAGPSAVDTLLIDLKHRAVAVTSRTPASMAPVTGNPGPAVGVNVFLEQEVEHDKRLRSLDLIRAAGMRWVRQQVPWEQVEPMEKGRFEDPKFGGSTWTKFDDIVAAARSRDVDLLFRLDTTPRWARAGDAPDGLGPPVRYEDYWDFVEAVARRYRGQVSAYQVWNEPNLHIEWGRRPPDAVAYVRLLRGAAERIRRADPDALVVMAALAPTLTDNREARNELLYLQDLYDAGVRDSFDVLAVQAYGLRGGPDDPRVADEDVTFSRPLRVREVMERNGDGGRPVWATEMGWNVAPASVVEQRFGHVTPALQARYTARALQRVRAEWPWLQNVFVWYWQRPDASEINQDWYWFRLADPDFTLQPVYYALRDFAAMSP